MKTIEKGYDGDENYAVFRAQDLLEYLNQLPADANVAITSDCYYSARFESKLNTKVNDDGVYVLVHINSRP